MKKIALILLFYVIFLIPKAYADDKIVAIVNKEIISQSDLNSFSKYIRMQLAEQYQAEALKEKIAETAPGLLDRLIEDKLIIQEAKKQNIKVDDNRIKARIDEMKKNYSSEKEFVDSLSSNGLTQADIENKIRDQMLMFEIVQQKIRNRIRICPREITDFYKEHKDQLNLPATRKILAMTSDKEDPLKKALKDLKTGMDFQQAADSSGLSINDLGQVMPGQLKKEIDQVISVLGPGEFSDIVKLDGKFYIFKLEELIAAKSRSFEEVKEDIYNYIFEEKMQEQMNKWLDELKAKAFIEKKNS